MPVSTSFAASTLPAWVLSEHCAVVHLCETCVNVSLAYWYRAEARWLAQSELGKLREVAQDGNRFKLECVPHHHFGSRTLEFEIPDLVTMRIVKATLSHVREVEHGRSRDISYADFRNEVTAFFSQSPCPGIDTLHEHIDLVELCEGYSLKTGMRCGFLPYVGNLVRIRLGESQFVGACVDASTTPRRWYLFGAGCLLLADRGSSSPCSVCYKQKRNAKDAIGRLAKRRAEIFQSPECHLRDRRWGDGRISSLSMSEQQTMLKFLYDVSEIRDEKVSFNPGSETDRPNKSVTSAHTPAHKPQRTRSSEPDVATAAATVLRERLADAAKALQDGAQQLKDLLDDVRTMGIIDFQRRTAMCLCVDAVSRWAKIFSSDNPTTLQGLSFTPETLHFSGALFHKLGRSSWTLLRNVIPLPHESTLRAAARGRPTTEGVKIVDLQQNLVEAVRRARKIRTAGTQVSPSSVFDVVISFDEMRVRPGHRWDARNGEMRGGATAHTLKSASEAINLRPEAQQKPATSWLTFIATPLLGGYSCRFNVASFAVGDLTSGELLKYINTVLTAVTCHGFRVRVLCCDGASYARKLQRRILTHTEADLVPGGLGLTPVAFEDPVFRANFIHWISDPSHWIKKMANNIWYSRPEGTRVLYMPTQDGRLAHLNFHSHLQKPWEILQAESPMLIEPPLTRTHFDRSANSTKMSVKMAAQLLSRKTIRVLERYEARLLEFEPDPDTRQSAAASLERMRTLIGMIDSVFDVLNGRKKEREHKRCDRHVLSRLFLRADSHELEVLREFTQMMHDWKLHILESYEHGRALVCADGEQRHMQLHENFVTWETEFDTNLCLNGMCSFVTYYTTVCGAAAVYPRVISSDCVENHFGSIRSFASGAAPMIAELAQLEASAAVVQNFNLHWKKRNSEQGDKENIIPVALLEHPQKKQRTERHVEAQTERMFRNAIHHLTDVATAPRLQHLR